MPFVVQRIIMYPDDFIFIMLCLLVHFIQVYRYRMQNELEKSEKSLADTLGKIFLNMSLLWYFVWNLFSFVHVYTWYLNQYIFTNFILTERKRHVCYLLWVVLIDATVADMGIPSYCEILHCVNSYVTWIYHIKTSSHDSHIYGHITHCD